MVDFNIPEGSTQSEECLLAISADIGIDLNASEEDTIVEEFNYLLRNKPILDLDKYGGFITNVIDGNEYRFMIDRDSVPIRDIEVMVDAAIKAIRTVNVEISKEDINVQSRDITKIYGPGLSEGE